MTSNAASQLVKDIMQTEVATISPMATLRTALQEMRAKKVKSLVVEKMHEHDAYGLITYSSILKTIVAEEGDIDLVNVYDIHEKPAISISGQVETRYAARMMVTHSIRRVLVLDNNELEGIVTMSDIIGTVLELLEE
ncbi:MAG TPA: CBS domain-containing protein [Halothiobacillaceae bacterium]|nr:CBS domain-containing protein [Halothiobacillaceae bacterium]